MWWESAPPFILIGLALAGMGHIQVNLTEATNLVSYLNLFFILTK